MARFENIFILKDQVSDKLTKIGNNLGKFNNKINKTQANLDGVNETLNKLGGALVAAFSVQKIAQIGTNISKLGMEFEDVRVDLETMLGSAEKADYMFKDIMTMAAKTPFESKDLLDATKQMLSFGIAEKDVIKYSKMLGDISGGNVDRYRSLVLAFSQASSVGKLQGQDKLQMINAGFNPLKEISEMTGKSMAQLDKEMSKGLISFDLVIKAMERATGKGGKFYNLMEKRSQTMSGKLSTLADTFGLWAGLTGEQINRKLLPILDKIAPIIEDSLNRITPVLLLLTDNFVKLFNQLGNNKELQSMMNDFKELGQSLEVFYTENQEFFNALKFQLNWILTSGLPKLGKLLAVLMKGLFNGFKVIHTIFSNIGKFIGNIVGFIMSIPSKIETVFRNLFTNFMKLFAPIFKMLGGKSIKTNTPSTNNSQTINFYGDINHQQSAFMMEQILSKPRYATGF